MESVLSTTETDTEAGKGKKTNRLGLMLDDYKGAESTLCKGCGHDAISASIMKSFYDLDVEQYRIAKLSGIGCSSKTTNYFFNGSHGFNSVHGRMSTIATGVSVANRTLLNIGVSGDGDTASIGLGNFCHMIRRNVPIIYIVENNGCYGLTKGQASATADKGSLMRGGRAIDQEAIDLCALAIQMGCGYVARSFSGDAKQVRALIKGAIAHQGSAVIDIISPCVTFNDHEGSTKSRAYARKFEDPLHDIDFIPRYENIEVEYDEGTMQVVKMHDGSTITLKKLNHEYDPTDQRQALDMLERVHLEGLFYTGLMYYDAQVPTIHDQINLIDTPLVHLNDGLIRPSDSVLKEIMDTFR
ncbi:MAG: hypothetical protein AMXMBFR84_36430 [Candidatus Hydrogenedentota bacterium]